MECGSSLPRLLPSYQYTTGVIRRPCIIHEHLNRAQFVHPDPDVKTRTILQEHVKPRRANEVNGPIFSCTKVNFLRKEASCRTLN